MIGPLFGVGLQLIRAAKNLADKSNEREQQEEQKSSYDASRLDAREIADSLTRAWTLRTKGLLTEDEFSSEKHRAMHDIAVKPVLQGTQDFLLELAPLIQEGILSVEELQKIKKCLEAKFNA